MRLQSLKLENIRSYENETINFPDNTTLLSGDIGCGKSSILYAIEFALFGASRSDLSADSLLKKGAISATVELQFSIDNNNNNNNNNIRIKRGLKKTSTGIKQTSGYVITNGIKKELTPVELKSEIINLLGYPKELATKDKNYIFRYTVYCPQEEMKLILQENEQNRLDILRKIFGIDRYKTIRDNLTPYLRDLRKEITILETKTQPIEQTQNKITNLQNQISLIEEKLKMLYPQKEQLLANILDLNDKIKLKEEKNKERIKLKNNLKTKLTLLNELEKNMLQNKQKLEDLTLQLKEILINQNHSISSINEEILKLEKEKSNFLQKKKSLQEKITFCQEKMSYTKRDLDSLKFEERLLIEKKQNIAKLKQNLLEKDSLIKKEKQIVELEQKTIQLKGKNLNLKEEAQKIIERISHLQECPTCLQNLSDEYKDNILKNQEDKKLVSEKFLLELNEKTVSLLYQKKEIKEQIENIINQEKELSKLELEIKVLEEKKIKEKEQKENLQKLIKENDSLLQNLAQINKDSVFAIDRINLRLEQLKKLIVKFERKINLEKQKENLVSQDKQITIKIDVLQKEIKIIETQLQNIPENEEELVNLKQNLEEIKQEEQKISLEETKNKTSLTHLNKELGDVSKDLESLIKDKNKLLKVKENHHWLNNFFFKLTYTIEKELLVRIYHHFNSLFQEWFSILIEDSQIYARLDENFTPIIEQNSHEISFSHLSGGEKTAISLAYRLALNKVINDVIHQINTKDLLILDEPTDGFSSQQLDKMRDVLEQLNLKQILLVSHEAKVESFVSNVIRIVKNEHISQVIC